MTPVEMRVKVAEVMGWRSIRTKTIHWADIGGGGLYDAPVGVDPRDGVEDELPDYPADLNAAIQLCDKLAEEGWEWMLTNLEGGGYSCEMFRPPNDPLFMHSAPTLAEAICGAFLKTRGLYFEGDEPNK